MVDESWNQLHSWVFEVSEAILDLSALRDGADTRIPLAFRYHK